MLNVNGFASSSPFVVVDVVVVVDVAVVVAVVVVVAAVSVVANKYFEAKVKHAHPLKNILLFVCECEDRKPFCTAGSPQWLRFFGRSSLFLLFFLKLRSLGSTTEIWSLIFWVKIGLRDLNSKPLGCTISSTEAITNP